jgi:hypothetical protein
VPNANAVADIRPKIIIGQKRAIEATTVLVPALTNHR